MGTTCTACNSVEYLNDITKVVLEGMNVSRGE